MNKQATTKHPRGTRKGKYRSLLEARIGEDLSRRGVPFDFERQSYSYTLKKRYTPDFFLPGGVIVEVKGWFKSSDRTKLKQVKQDNPSLDIRLLFQRANSRLSKLSNTTYAEWAEANGFPWAEGSIPKDWIIAKQT